MCDNFILDLDAIGYGVKRERKIFLLVDFIHYFKGLLFCSQLMLTYTQTNHYFVQQRINKIHKHKKWRMRTKRIFSLRYFCLAWKNINVERTANRKKVFEGERNRRIIIIRLQSTFCHCVGREMDEGPSVRLMKWDYVFFLSWMRIDIRWSSYFQWTFFFLVKSLSIQRDGKVVLK